jgi:hypothetical protein
MTKQIHRKPNKSPLLIGPSMPCCTRIGWTALAIDRGTSKSRDMTSCLEFFFAYGNKLNINRQSLLLTSFEG